jgi:hypothetical protein
MFFGAYQQLAPLALLRRWEWVDLCDGGISGAYECAQRLCPIRKAVPPGLLIPDELTQGWVGRWEIGCRNGVEPRKCFSYISEGNWADFPLGERCSNWNAISLFGHNCANFLVGENDFESNTFICGQPLSREHFAKACKRLGLKHIFTKPYTPKTNGKAERFIQTSLRDWAYARAYNTSDERTAELPRWIHRYNWHRPHRSIGSKPPISRLGLTGNNLLRLHSWVTGAEWPRAAASSTLPGYRHPRRRSYFF